MTNLSKVKKDIRRIFKMMPSEEAFLEEEAKNGGYEKIEAQLAIEELIEHSLLTKRKEIIEDIKEMKCVDKELKDNFDMARSAIVELLKEL